MAAVLAGIAMSAIGGSAGGGGLLGGVLGGGGGAGGLLGGVLDEILGGDAAGGERAGGSLFNPSDLGLPSPAELLKQGPSVAEQLLSKQSPLDLLLGGAQGGGQGPFG